MPKRFPLEFKRDLVAVARSGGGTVAEVAAEFDIAESAFYRWIHRGGP